jgi:mannose-6-phosphate isomerase-like protein (cupin superfamily)
MEGERGAQAQQFAAVRRPTNISANVRIVAGEDPPLTHETTADLWIVTAGTRWPDGRQARHKWIRQLHHQRDGANGAPGDVLYVPPGVPHHFTQMKGFRAWLMRFDTLGLVRTTPAPAAPRGAGRGGCPAAARGGSRTSGALRRAETVHRQDDVLDGGRHRRTLEGKRSAEANQLPHLRRPANISANVRIVLPGDEPQTHEGTADLWLVTAGEAIARTDGEIVEANGNKTIRNGMMRPVHPGDLLYVPPGVPHHFHRHEGIQSLVDPL